MAILYFKGGAYVDGGIKSAAGKNKVAACSSSNHQLKRVSLANLLSNTWNSLKLHPPAPRVK